MNPEQQRLKIAEACGWRLNKNKHTSKSLDWIGPDDQRTYMPPDYLNDLNAMQEAEKALIGGNNWELCDYVHRLHHATNGWPALATAAQRAEAFLKTLGLWEEGGGM